MCRPLLLLLLLSLLSACADGDPLLSGPGGELLLDTAGSLPGARVPAEDRVPVALDDPAVWTVMGSAEGQQRGARVLGGSDFNGDGYLDVVSGSPYWDSPATDAGLVELFYGSATFPSTTPDWAVSGPSSGANFGWLLSGGDVNGDGIDDLVVSAAGLSNGHTHEGGVYAYLGSVGGLSTTPSWSLEGNATNVYLGYGLDASGDYDSDGDDDVIVGVPGYSGSRGQARVYEGGPAGPSTSPDMTIYSTSPIGLGWSVSSLGDFNGDGFGDAAVGSNGVAAYLWLGTSAGLMSTAWTGYVGLSSSCFACSVVGPGDLDGDGYDEFAVGAPSYEVTTDTATLPGAGAVWIFRGNGTSMLDEGWVLSGDQRSGQMGHPFRVGDANGDGYDDIAVGSPYYDDTYTDEGHISLYMGGPDGLWSTSRPYAEWSGGQAGAALWFASGVGDLDGDGVGDIVMGAAGHDGASTDGGILSIVTGTLDVDLDGSPGSEDCDDEEDTVHPGATEIVGDGIDQDCDGQETCYTDADGDGYGSSSLLLSEDPDCDDPGEADVATDCDDADAARYPGATELVADGVDSDCSGTELCYRDADRDGFGGTRTTVSADLDCADLGESTISTDCNDLSSSVNPSATERPGDGIDQDCDGIDGCYLDLDLDGYGTATAVASADGDCADAGESYLSTDCDDADPELHPGAEETVADGVDQDCDGHDTCYADVDRDGHGASITRVAVGATCTGTAESTLSDDCDDASSTVWPGAAELVADGIDQDCDGGDLCYADTDGDGFGATVTVPSLDLDCASSGESSLDTDCDEGNADIHPGAAELVADGVDQDCDAHDTCYVDSDLDGHGGAATRDASGLVCTGPGEATLSDDCDDASSTVWPGAAELVADGIDQDCDGGDLCYADTDTDGFGTSTTIASADTDCADSGESTLATDCDDTTSTVAPGTSELLADGVDQDCDGGDTCFVDADGDHHGTLATLLSVDLDCAGPGESSLSDDCDDTSATVYAGAPELVADLLDQDCDGGDTCWADADGDGHGGAETVSSVDLACDAPGEASISDDCDDGQATTWPGAKESVADGVDQDCDGLELCWSDEDDDGWGSEETVLGTLPCDAPGEAPERGDCDPEELLIHPEADETVADGVDQDCDGGDFCYRDTDGDGYGGEGTISSANLSCADSGESINASDCDDEAASVFPGAAEVPDDGVDQNCDGVDATTPGVDDTGDKEDDTDGPGAKEPAGCGGCSSGGGVPKGAGILGLALMALLRRRQD